MPQKSIEIILFRQLVTYITIPAFIVDIDDSILYCNNAAEKVFGFKFSEIGEIQAKNWQILFSPKDKNGHSVAIETSPLYISASQYCLAHGQFYIMNLQDAKLKKIELYAIPVLNNTHTHLGTIAFFQEIKS
jgi:PAS domain S-box-containing protein